MRIESSGIEWSRQEQLRARWLRFGALSCVLGALVRPIEYFAPHALQSTVVLASWAALGIGGLAALVGLFGDARRPRGLPGVVEVERDALVVAGRRFAIADVEQGWVDDAGDMTLRFRDKVEAVVRVGDRGEGERLLAALGVSTDRRVLRVPLRSAASLQARGHAARFAALVALVMCLPWLLERTVRFLVSPIVLSSLFRVKLSSSFIALDLALTAALAAVTALALWGVRRLLRAVVRREAVVGTDGVVIEGYGTRETIPYARVAEVVRHPLGVCLALHDGERVVLPTVVDSPEPLPTAEAAPPPEGARGDVVRRDALLARIQQAMAYARAGGARQAHLEQLDRRGDGVAAWRERLRVLAGTGVEGGGYRRPSIDGDELASIVGDAGVAPERRVAAAVALASLGDERARTGVRIAVDACVDEDLRAALEQASEGEIDEPALQKLAMRSGGAH